MERDNLLDSEGEDLLTNDPKTNSVETPFWSN